MVTMWLFIHFGFSLHRGQRLTRLERGSTFKYTIKLFPDKIMTLKFQNPTLPVACKAKLYAVGSDNIIIRKDLCHAHDLDVKKSNPLIINVRVKRKATEFAIHNACRSIWEK